MFEQSLFVSSGNRRNTKTWITVPASLIVHAFLIALLVVGPLMKASTDLPEIEVINIFTTNEAPAPPQPPPAAKKKSGSSSSRRERAEREQTQQQQQSAAIDPSRLIAPVEIPDDIPEAEIDFGGLLDDDSTGGSEFGVEGGVEGGVIGGVLGSDLIDEGDAIQNAVKLGSVRTPRVIRRVRPQFPPAALQARITGRVVVRAVTDIYGKVARVEIVSSAHPLLNAACVKAIRQWLYEPYIINGVPRPVEFIVKLDFDLSNI